LTTKICRIYQHKLHLLLQIHLTISSLINLFKNNLNNAESFFLKYIASGGHRIILTLYSSYIGSVQWQRDYPDTERYDAEGSCCSGRFRSHQLRTLFIADYINYTKNSYALNKQRGRFVGCL
jgi:hypothetical protein